MKLAIELVTLVVFVVCLSTAFKAFLHLRHHEQRRSEEAEARKQVTDRPKKLGRTA